MLSSRVQEYASIAQLVERPPCKRMVVSSNLTAGSNKKMTPQIKTILPKTAWENISIHESNEVMVEITETNRIKIGLVKKKYQPSFYVRETVRGKLIAASEKLPKGMSIVLIEGYRSVETQQLLWNRKFNQLKEENPKWTNEETEQALKMVLAKPSPLSNHNCGGAIDVTISHSDGALADMGNPYPSEDTFEQWREKFPMFSEKITADQKRYREVLRHVMESQDFVWYPGEWWHYCWGDRMWAVYSGQTICFYGPTQT